MCDAIYSTCTCTSNSVFQRCIPGLSDTHSHIQCIHVHAHQLICKFMCVHFGMYTITYGVLLRIIWYWLSRYYQFKLGIMHALCFDWGICINPCSVHNGIAVICVLNCVWTYVITHATNAKLGTSYSTENTRFV